MRVELFYSPYCTQCRRAREQMKSLSAAWPPAQVSFHELNVLDELERAVALGIMQTPALAIDGRLVSGPMPSRKALDQLLRRRLNSGRTR